MKDAYTFIKILLTWLLNTGIDFNGIYVTFGGVLMFIAGIWIIIQIFKAIWGK